MPEYIEVETAVDFVKNNTPCFGDETSMRCVERSIRNAPTADVVEVVRCKKCRHFSASNPSFCKYHTNNASYCDEACWVTENDFCSYGKRKEVKDA